MSAMVYYRECPDCAKSSFVRWMRKLEQMAPWECPVCGFYTDDPSECRFASKFRLLRPTDAPLLAG